jgi:hypothetical protein
MVMRPQPPGSVVAAMCLIRSGQPPLFPIIRGGIGVTALEGHSQETAEAHERVIEIGPIFWGFVIHSNI